MSASPSIAARPLRSPSASPENESILRGGTHSARTISNAGSSKDNVNTQNVSSPGSVRGKRNSNGHGKHSLGLSELSKQLRILQNQNQVQKIEIDRLERQLKLLADLQSISVADLRSALNKACEDEAHAELQRTVASLKAQLRAATLASQKGGNVKEVSASNDIADLQLRLGELEELDEKRKAEIDKLYSDLAAERERATRLEAKCASQESQLGQARSKAERDRLDMDEFAKEMKNMQSQLSFMETTAQMQQAELDEWAALGKRLKKSQDDRESFKATERSQVDRKHIKQLQDKLQKEREKVKQLELAIRRAKMDVSSLRDDVNRAKAAGAESKRQASMEAQVLKDRNAILGKQLATASEQHALRNDQFKARFAMQTERVQDLEQQLSSLYVAFEMLKSDRSAEDATRDALLANLATADAKVAQQVEAMEKNQGRGSSSRSRDESSTRADSAYGDYDATFLQSHLGPPLSPLPVAGGGSSSVRAVSPVAASPPLHSPTRARSSPSVSKSPRPRPFPQQHKARDNFGNTIMSGDLLVRTSGMVKQWKRRTASLFQSSNRYHIVIYADETSKQKMYSAPVGVSRVEQNPKQSHGFLIYINPRDPSAPVVHAAAVDDRDYRKWMPALKFAMCTGGTGSSSPSSSSSSQRLQQPQSGQLVSSQGTTAIAPSSAGQQSLRSSSDQSSTIAEQEQRDLELALQLSAQS